MSRILALIAVAGLLSLAACQSAPEKAPQAAVGQAAAEQPAAGTTAAPAEAVPPTAPAVEQAPAAPAKASEPVQAAPATPEPEAATPKAPAAKPATISKEEALALAGKGNCLTCHKIEKRVVGPAWKDVAAKYRNDPNAAATIAAHIKQGGSFGWKFGSMPPRGGSKLSDADVARLAGFIAGLK